MGSTAVCNDVSLATGITTYLDARKANYFARPVSAEEQKQLETFQSQHPDVYTELNEMTNKAEMPGSRYINMPWLFRYINPIAETVSSVFGQHNAILNALRPVYNTSHVAYHENNIDAYLHAVKRYMYNRYNVESHEPRDILAQLIDNLSLEYVYDIPYRHNLFVQLFATTSEDDIKYILQYIKQKSPQQFEQKKEMLLSLLTHFEHIPLVIQAVVQDAIEQADTEQTNTNTQTA